MQCNDVRYTTPSKFQADTETLLTAAGVVSNFFLSLDVTAVIVTGLCARK